MDEIAIDRLFQEGVAAIRAGNKAAGKEKLSQVVQHDPLHEQAWLWLSAAVDTGDERIICLQNVLTINPNNEAARKGLKQLGVDYLAPPPARDPAPPPPSQQAEFVSSALAGEKYEAIMEGKKPPPEEKKPPAADEAWRAVLEDKDYKGHTASLIPDKLDHPSPGVRELFGVWLDMIIFHAGDEFDEEVKYGNIWHVAINVGVAGLFQIIVTAILFLLLIVLPGDNFTPPFYRSLEDYFATLDAQSTTTDFGENSASFSEVFDELMKGDPETQQAMGLMGILMVGAMIASIPVMFVMMLLQSIIVNSVAGWLMRGKGDVLTTLHALTIAQVAGQVVGIPLAIFTPFLNVWAAFLIWGVLGFYQFALASLAVGRAQKLNILVGAGVLIISGVAVNALSSMAMCLLSLFLG